MRKCRSPGGVTSGARGTGTGFPEVQARLVRGCEQRISEKVSSSPWRNKRSKKPMELRIQSLHSSRSAGRTLPRRPEVGCLSAIKAEWEMDGQEYRKTSLPERTTVTQFLTNHRNELNIPRRVRRAT